MTDTFESIWNEVHGHSKSVDPLLVQSWVRDTWRELAESRSWSWLRKRHVVTIPAPYSTGTVALTPDDTLATFTGATLTTAMIGRQFRIGTGTIYDITSVDTAAGTAQIWPPWVDTTAAVTGQSYKIFTAYILPPDPEFFAWITVSDTSTRRRLRLHVNQETITYHDASRRMTSLGPACLSGIDWSTSYSGKVHTVVQVNGSGPRPVSDGTYTGQTDSLIVVKVTTGGALDTAEFSWRKDEGTLHTGNVITAVGNELPEGIGLTWPNDTFILNDIFVVRVTAKPKYGQPRYELYPHHTTALYLPCVYTTRVHDIDESGFVLPYTIRGDVIKCGALAKMARYPGTNDRPNPYAQQARAQYFEEKFQNELGVLATADDYIMETNVIDGSETWDYALLPWMTASGSGMRPTADFDPYDLFI